MRILMLRPGPFPPELFAGTELALHWLCKTLIVNGHDVVVAAQSKRQPNMRPTLDRECGYPVVRATAIDDAASAAAKGFRPDVIVIIESSSWLSYIAPIIANTPFLIYEHEVAAAPEKTPAEFRERAVYVANSAVTAANLAKICGVKATVVPPLFGVDRYDGIERKGERVLFVSLQRRKGSDVAIRIAQMRPKNSFIFVESWTEDMERTKFLRDFVSRVPNIELLPNQPSLEAILPQLKLLLMPSRSQEAWGRMATEAQICGIPVLGSSRGNLPVTIGPGGVTLDPDEPIERWLAAFDRFMNEPAFYADVAGKAYAQGRARIKDVRKSYETFERALHEAVVRHAA